MTQIALQVKGLVKRFGESNAVDHIDFDVPTGSITALLGGNGAGKTTTLSMLLGLLTPTSGQVSILGMDMPKDRYAILEKINFSSPYVDLPQRLTVRQNLTVYGKLYTVSDLQQVIAQLAQDLDLEKLLDRRTSTLSAGQKTRLALAKALINRPSLLLLDEPTASLDPDSGDWIRTYLEKYCQDNGTTILMASHNMAEVERLCDQVLMMKAGRIIDRGTPAQLIERHGREDLEEVFLHLARHG